MASPPAGPAPSTPTLPAWAPTLLQVAAYVPHRTLAQDIATNTAGADVYRLNFDLTTRPSSTQVTQLIADGCAWVASQAIPLNVLSEPAAAVVVTLWAAAAVERGWPADDSSLQRANDLEKRMDLMLTGLMESNDAANGTDDYGLEIVAPAWSFPPADTRYDSASYW